MSGFVNYNGNLLRSDQPLVSADNRGLKYGDGLFETMRMANGELPLWDLHVDRLFHGLKLLQFDLPGSFTSETLLQEIKKLCEENETAKSARIRLTIFRGDGGLYDPSDHRPNYLIQSWNIDPLTADINEKGLEIDYFPAVRKSCDPLANIKSNNFLTYSMAALFAKENQLDDCLILNSKERISDSTIANVYLVNDDLIKTPLLSEGCVAGVMRRWLLENSINHGFNLVQEPLGIEQFLKADEIFLSNAVQGIRWVRKFRDKEYSNKVSSIVYKTLVKSLFLK